MLLGRIGDKHPIKPARKPEISNLKNMPNTNAEFEKIRNTINYAELGINVCTSPKNIRSQKILLPHNRNKESWGTKMY